MILPKIHVILPFEADDLLILPPLCFNLPVWAEFESKTNTFWKTVAGCFKVNRIAQENRVKSDDFRSPNLTLLFGRDPIVVINNNGIKYFSYISCVYDIVPIN